MKKIFIILAGLLLTANLANATVKKATVFHPITGERKVVTVGDPDAFDGGFRLETPTDYFNPILGATVPLAVADFETSLAQKLTSTETSSMTLVSGTTGDGTTLNGIYGFTIDEGNSYKEYVIATCVDTACSSLTRGISTVTGSSSVAALKKDHRRGANVKITDHPIITVMARILNGQDTIPAKLIYDDTLQIGVGDATSTIPTKYYVDNIAIAGGTTATEGTPGISKIGTAQQIASSTFSAGDPTVIPTSRATSSPDVRSLGNIPATGNDGYLNQGWLDLSETFTFTGGVDGIIIGKNISILTASTTITGASTPQPVYIATTTGALELSDANNDTTYYAFHGFAISSGVNGESIYVQTKGVVTGFTGLTPGADYYVQDSVGTIGTSKGTTPLKVGRALTSTTLMIDRQKTFGTFAAKTDNTEYFAYTDGNLYCWAGDGSGASAMTAYINNTIYIKDNNSTNGGVSGFALFVAAGQKYKCDGAVTGGTNSIYWQPFN